MSIFLHIGMGKTGTTSIQTFLEVNSAALAARGIVTPTTLARRNHRRLTMYALNDGTVDNLRRAKRMITPESVRVFRERLIASFMEEATTWKPDQTIVMTSEQMTRLRSVEEVRRLKDFVDMVGHADIRVIVYVRRQDLAQISMYSQWIKGGSVVPFRSDLAMGNDATLFYDRFLAPWAEVFGRSPIIVRPFEQSSLRNGDAVDDFMAIIGVDDLSGFVRPPRANTSLDIYTVEFLRRLNPYVPRWLENDKPDGSRDILISALEAISDGPKLSMSRESAEQFLSRFAECNACVARDYLDKDRLFQEEIRDGPGIQPVLPLEAAFHIARTLFAQTIVPRFDVDRLICFTADSWNRC